MAIAVLQGVSELFPVSSLGHAVIVPAFLHWSIDRSDPTYLAFLVVLHLGTVLALLLFYRETWLAIARAWWASIVRGRLSDDPHERMGWLVVLATLPVGLLGASLEAPVRQLFSSTIAVGCFLIINAFMMWGGEVLRRHRAGDRPLDALTWRDAVLIGFAQAFALLPGISRSGSAITAGLLLRLNHEDAARYAFLLATPVILAASLLEIPRLVAPEVHLALTESLCGGFLAAVTAYVSLRFLTRYLRDHDLRPFAVYCALLGVATVGMSVFSHLR